jgi:hypothetical protein
MANAKLKQKQTVVATASALPFTPESEAAITRVGAARGGYKEAVKDCARTLYSTGVTAAMFYVVDTNDAKKLAARKECFTRSNGVVNQTHVRKLLARALGGEAGLELMTMPAELRPETRATEYTELMTEVNGSVKDIARKLQKIEDDETPQHGDSEKRVKDTLFTEWEQKMVDIQNWVMAFKGMQDVPASDLALITRDARKQGRALLAPKAK